MDSLRTLSQDLTRLHQRLTGLLTSLASPDGNLSTYVPDLDVVTQRLTATFGPSPDLIVRRFSVASGTSGLIGYLDHLVDVTIIDRDILRPLMQGTRTVDALPVGQATASKDWDTLIAAITQGNTVVCLRDVPTAWVIDTAQIPHRSLDRAETELAVRGPQEGFAEVLALQLSQVRHRLQSPTLTFEQLTVGSRYPVGIAIAYLQDVVNPALVAAVRERVQRIHAETVVNGTMVASYLRDRPGSLMPTVRNTERVDLIVWHLLNGKVAILVDGDPNVLSVPATLCDFYRTSDDYATAWYNTTFVRFIRWLGWGFGVYLPALYIALTEVNPDLVPPPLVILTAGSHTGLPFTPIVEVLVMILLIEILREAALRLPKMLSTTIGTIGAIVVGTAVVKAGFVSPQIIVVMTLTALSFFSGPSYELTGTWRIVGWIMLVAAFIYGVYGIVLATVGLSIKLVTETSFGVPYLTPLAPFRPVDGDDLMWRSPWTRFAHRHTTSRSTDNMWNPGPAQPPSNPHLRRGQIKHR